MDSVVDTSVDLYRARGENSVPAMIAGIMQDPKQEDRGEDQDQDPRAEEGKLLTFRSLTLPVFALTSNGPKCFYLCFEVRLYFCWHEREGGK